MAIPAERAVWPILLAVQWMRPAARWQLPLLANALGWRISDLGDTCLAGGPAGAGGLGPAAMAAGWDHCEALVLRLAMKGGVP